MRYLTFELSLHTIIYTTTVRPTQTPILTNNKYYCPTLAHTNAFWNAELKIRMPAIL